jgi:hypothetical protein
MTITVGIALVTLIGSVINAELERRLALRRAEESRSETESPDCEPTEES